MVCFFLRNTVTFAHTFTHHDFALFNHRRERKRTPFITPPPSHGLSVSFYISHVADELAFAN